MVDDMHGPKLWAEIGKEKDRKYMNSRHEIKIVSWHLFVKYAI
jgi:hypothetical protein